MPADLIHLVRHGEVENPDGVLYGRLDGFPLSERGVRMAQATADWIAGLGTARAVTSSPLLRAVQSAEPIARAIGVEVATRDGLVEASSRLEGGRFRMDASILGKPAAWRYLVNPFRPSWGEAFAAVAARMRLELEAARDSVGSGDVVLVSHQLPIWMVHRSLAGKPLFHDPRKRRCSLSSVTTVAWREGRFVEIGYAEPAREIAAASREEGAV